jgi:hypothetical protein
MSFLDKMKKKAEELELDKKAKGLQETATVAAKQAREKAGGFTADNRDKIDRYVEKAAATIDTKTDGKYADKVAKVKETVGKGVDKVAEGSPSTAQSTSTPPPAGSPAPQADSAGQSTFPLDPDAPVAPPQGETRATPPPPHGV